MDGKIKTWPLRFPAKETPNMEKTLFDWPIVFLQYDVKTRFRLNSRKFSGMKFFLPRAFAYPTKSKARLYPFDQIVLFPFVCCHVPFCSRVFSSNSS